MAVIVYMKRGERSAPTWIWTRRRYNGRVWYVLRDAGEIIGWRKAKRLKRKTATPALKAAYDEGVRRLISRRR